MKISFISPYSDITSLGIRQLSSVVREQGFNCRLVFIPEFRPEYHEHGDSWGSDETIIFEQVLDLVRDSDLIGLSLMSNYVIRSVHLTRYLRSRLNSQCLIVWGGIHPTIRPQQSLQYADAVCLGEGEVAFAELVTQLARDSDYFKIGNFWFNQNKSIIRNEPRALISDLDELPFPDYQLRDDYVYSPEMKVFQQMDSNLLAQQLARGYISGIRKKIAYQTIATRGCPHNCTYCCNNSLRELYGSKNYLRRRSNDHILSELRTITQHYPFIEEIGFSDDSFFATSLEQIQNFASRYAAEIALPFFCLGSPTTISAEKMEALTEAGLYGIQMGIQTGSPRVQKLYKRTTSNSKILEAASLLHKFRHKLIPPTYDIIIDNPYETLQDHRATFSLLRQLPRPHRIQIFSLVLFPETELYQQALDDGLLSDNDELHPIKEYHHRQKTYSNIVFALFGRNFPRPLLAILTWQPLLILFDTPLFHFFIARLYQLHLRYKTRANNKSSTE